MLFARSVRPYSRANDFMTCGEMSLCGTGSSGSPARPASGVSFAVYKGGASSGVMDMLRTGVKARLSEGQAQCLEQ